MLRPTDSAANGASSGCFNISCDTSGRKTGFCSSSTRAAAPMREILVPILIGGASASRSNSKTCRLSPSLVQDVEVGSMEATSAGQNATQAVQDGFYRGLIGHSAGHVQQSSISSSVTRYHVRDPRAHKKNAPLNSIHLVIKPNYQPL